jgi:phosphoenolpyruvate-protein kinase (PTS system EI component)
MNMFERIYNIKAEQTREDLFEQKNFKVTPQAKINTIKRIRSAKTVATTPVGHYRSESLAINQSKFLPLRKF